MFHTREETENTPNPKFLVAKFLQEQSITGLIGPARARKSIITVNLIHALLTGDHLFGQYEVVEKPERVIYLCPEAGLMSTAKRLRNMGLAKFVGDKLFYTSMNSESVELLDPILLEPSRGAVVIIDTAVRFFNGDENSASDMKKFGDQCQALIRNGVRAVLLLHHTKKAAEGVTLEGGRGSGDFGGFLTCCWGTTLDDYDNAYTSASVMKPVKERDFRAESFKLAASGDEDNFFLTYVDGSAGVKVNVGTKEKPEKDAAIAFIRDNPTLSSEAASRALAAKGINYSSSWCRKAQRDSKGHIPGSNP